MKIRLGILERLTESSLLSYQNPVPLYFELTTSKINTYKTANFVRHYGNTVLNEEEVITNEPKVKKLPIGLCRLEFEKIDNQWCYFGIMEDNPSISLDHYMRLNITISMNTTFFLYEIVLSDSPCYAPGFNSIQLKECIIKSPLNEKTKNAVQS